MSFAVVTVMAFAGGLACGESKGLGDSPRPP